MNLYVLLWLQKLLMSCMNIFVRIEYNSVCVWLAINPFRFIRQLGGAAAMLDCKHNKS